jgi:serine/threonine protein kinase
LIGNDQPEIKGDRKNENDDDEFDDYFDFVIIEKEEIQQMVDESIVVKQKERVDKEMAAMQASKSEVVAI